MAGQIVFFVGIFLLGITNGQTTQVPGCPEPCSACKTFTEGNYTGTWNLVSKFSPRCPNSCLYEKDGKEMCFCDPGTIKYETQHGTCSTESEFEDFQRALTDDLDNDISNLTCDNLELFKKHKKKCRVTTIISCGRIIWKEIKKCYHCKKASDEFTCVTKCIDKLIDKIKKCVPCLKKVLHKVCCHAGWLKPICCNKTDADFDTALGLSGASNISGHTFRITIDNTLNKTFTGVISYTSDCTNPTSAYSVPAMGSHRATNTWNGTTPCQVTGITAGNCNQWTGVANTGATFNIIMGSPCIVQIIF